MVGSVAVDVLQLSVKQEFIIKHFNPTQSTSGKKIAWGDSASSDFDGIAVVCTIMATVVGAYGTIAQMGESFFNNAQSKSVYAKATFDTAWIQLKPQLKKLKIAGQQALNTPNDFITYLRKNGSLKTANGNLLLAKAFQELLNALPAKSYVLNITRHELNSLARELEALNKELAELAGGKDIEKLQIRNPKQYAQKMKQLLARISKIREIFGL